MTGEAVSAGQRWVWVTRPDYYLDKNGNDRAELDPDQGYEHEGWWTCHPDTQEGDLVLLYRSQKHKDIAYLIKTRSAAYPLDPRLAEPGWDWACDYEVIQKFSKPLPLAEMKADEQLRAWSALRANFQRKTYRIPPNIWRRLIDLLGADDRAYAEIRVNTADRRLWMEREIEEQLARDPSVFLKFGLRLELKARQWICSNGGRIDLLYLEAGKFRKRYVVVELKRGLVGPQAAGQLLGYLANVDREYPQSRKPLGVLVGERLDQKARAMVGDHRQLRFISLTELGIGRFSIDL